MLNWIWTTLGIGAGYWILSLIAFTLGGCETCLGDESWRDERYEELYYTFLAPTGAIAVLCSVVLVLVYVTLK